MAELYCKKCIMNERNPNIILDEQGVCNLCNHGVIKQSVQKYRQAVRNYTDFKSNVKKADRYYDCILMLSGGKDSTYMLYKLVAEDKLRPLALTINHPYESKNAVRNIERTVEQLGVDHMMFTYNVETYKKLMNMILTKRPETYGGNLERMEKMPCMACTCYLKISSYLAAYRLQIPYILYCADPQQSASMNIDIKQIIEELIDYCGEELTNELFENQLKEILTGDPEKLPKFVFPYAVMNDYNQSRIISILKGLNLYQTSIRETHCSLHSLLNYYSFKKYGCALYSVEKASDVRAGMLNRDMAIDLMEKYKKIFLDIAPKPEISQEEKSFILDVLGNFYPGAPETVEYEYNNIMSMRRVAESLGLDINQIE